MPLQPAVELALKLKGALSEQVEHARTARQVFKSMSPEALLAHAAERERFNSVAADLSLQLANTLQQASEAAGQDVLRLDELKKLSPFEGEQLAGVMRELRSLAASLAQLDEFNQRMAAKALTFVRAYVAQLAPPPAAYTRSGLAPQREASTLSEHA